MPKKIKHKHQTKKDGNALYPTLGKPILLSLPITLAIGMLLLLGSASLLLTTKDPGRYPAVVGPILLYLTALIGGMIAARLAHRRLPLVCGLGHGILLALTIALIALFLPQSEHASSSIGLAALTHAGVVLASLLGSVLSGRQKRRRRRH